MYDENYDTEALQNDIPDIMDDIEYKGNIWNEVENQKLIDNIQQFIKTDKSMFAIIYLFNIYIANSHKNNIYKYF